MKRVIHFREVTNNGTGYWGLLGLFALIVAVGLGAAYYMEHNGHWVTGMNNQIVWGTPHVFAVFLIVAASGALNVASIASVFNKKFYKPLAPLSALLAVALLIGGLIILVLDLGRPDRLIVAMTHYNFKSIFAWNIILYNGFIAIVAVYIWFMMEPRMKPYSSYAGFFAFVWRIILTTGTGSIFGFLVARQAYDAAIYAPMFVVMSFSFGLAIYLLVLMAAMKWTGRPLGDAVVSRLKNLLGVFVAGVFYFVLAYHLTSLYATEHHGWERFLLLDGGLYTKLFWIGQILIGTLLPLAMLYHPTLGKSRAVVAWACVFVILGGLAQMYTIIIGGQAYPLVLFPGMEVSSDFSDGIVAAYTPALPEFLLGIGGMGIALLAVTVAVKVLRFLPETLEDDRVDPHRAAEAEAAEAA
ncbi:NrfD/PsrC family molybdoenzyme membrane anchor subunit [Thiohalobacter sp.]|uniref:NrfD/PsrC family molybdoenzyme membrane anchor subunit n=1 Tax=Thiohalobacter sp. TaxID=2025948 RepID=UPI0026072AB3|nr:NrfD/PsrC family molybdoenzyme membrane anchor subunit [Thiohalobacter sp.]